MTAVATLSCTCVGLLYMLLELWLMTGICVLSCAFRHENPALHCTVLSGHQAASEGHTCSMTAATLYKKSSGKEKHAERPWHNRRSQVSGRGTSLFILQCSGTDGKHVQHKQQHIHLWSRSRSEYLKNCPTRPACNLVRQGVLIGVHGWESVSTPAEAVCTRRLTLRLTQPSSFDRVYSRC